MPARRERSLRVAAAALLLGLAWYLGSDASAPWPAGSERPPAVASAVAPRSDDALVQAAFRERRSGVWVELAGTVEATLPDDDDGSRHQRFILRLAGDHTLLVAHNIDLAARAPVRRGEAIRLRGEYAWNERGGVVHWTHRDPQGRHEGGWIEHAGRRYR